MAGNVESQLRVKKGPYYALQIDETIHITNHEQLMCYIRYAHDNIHDDILFCRTLQTRTTGEEIFHTLGSYIRSSGENVRASVRMELAPLQAGIVGLFLRSRK
jgi:hypothetical protein